MPLSKFDISPALLLAAQFQRRRFSLPIQSALPLPASRSVRNKCLQPSKLFRAVSTAPPFYLQTAILASAPHLHCSPTPPQANENPVPRKTGAQSHCDLPRPNH